MVLSLASNPSCLLLDDELNILPTSSHVRSIEPLATDADRPGSAKDTELKGLFDSLSDTLVCQTQQRSSIHSFIDMSASLHHVLARCVACATSCLPRLSACLGSSV